MMRRAMIEGKCGLLALCVSESRGHSTSWDGPRALDTRLGTTMMRRMIGRYKGCRCARMGRASRGAGAVFNGGVDAVANTDVPYLIRGSMGDAYSMKMAL